MVDETAPQSSDKVVTMEEGVPTHDGKGKLKRLSTYSKKFDVDGDGELDEAEKASEFAHSVALL